MDTIRHGVTVLGCIVLLAGCQEDGPAASSDTSAGPDLLQIASQQCERKGGRWGLTPGKATYACFRELSDAGDTCRAESDCQGLCLARSRTCSPIEPFFGCHEVLSDTGFRQTLCIE
ncbi:MAG: hypothetical protein KJO42_03590 [Silicimonas sp.]|nr:hypothetical protein [Silicimonas sp.]MBT8425183.1 hypothetical protein [Silicimonas sp.]NND17588.1 hypothetical protein [Silicimonas sp.]NNL36585.1 hypothetical protein [Silicimonas sp.]RZW11754.1 MAG: hypothetical protein EX266_02225 [Paracoccaceae bacterium]